MDSDSLIFKKITAKDFADISEFFKYNDARFCHLTIGSLFMWSDFFSSEFCIADGGLIISSIDLDGQTSFCPPLGGDTREILKKLYAYAKAKYGYLKLNSVSEDKAEHYKNLMSEISGGKQYEAVHLEDWFDYMYRAEDLISLSGKKYHGQRNFINRFKRENPVYSFELIDKDNIAEARSFVSALSNASGGERLAEYENLAVLKLLHNYDELNQTGYLLSVSGVAAGVAIGEVVGDTLHEHVEKADKRFAGVFPFLSNQYITAMKERHPEITIVNREEDLGDAGIRYAKECYHPLYKNYKYYVFCKDDIM